MLYAISIPFWQTGTASKHAQTKFVANFRQKIIKFNYSNIKDGNLVASVKMMIIFNPKLLAVVSSSCAAKCYQHCEKGDKKVFVKKCYISLSGTCSTVKNLANSNSNS